METTQMHHTHTHTTTMVNNLRVGVRKQPTCTLRVVNTGEHVRILYI